MKYLIKLDPFFRYQGKAPQIPKVAKRCHYAKAEACIHAYADGSTGYFTARAGWRISLRKARSHTNPTEVHQTVA